MNTKNLNHDLLEYKKIDLDLAILAKQKELLKQKIANKLKEEEMDSLSLGEFSVSISKFPREMFIKKQLEEFVDSKVLNKCKKTIVIERTNIKYEK